jgi:predicted ATPase/DNA-binding CsgD family transcriptional regulator
VRGVALPRGTLTFLFSDIEGSTRLLADDEAAYANARSEHLRVLREALAAHEGVEVDTAGDGLFAVFASARSAVAAAEQSQAGFDGFRVRMGLHSGEAAPTTNGYVGMDVHRAARIAAAAHGGQVVISAATRGLLDSTAELLDLGEHRLKDLEQPLRLYQLGDAAFPPLSSLGRTNLPVPQAGFVGRVRELSEVSALLARDGVRLVTLTGPGGTGKTRLALQVAAQQAERYPDGVWLVGLAALTDAREVVSAISAALGIPGDLKLALANQRSLLVLDNFEHLLEAARQLGDLITACASVDVLVTSRAPLRLDGEWTYAVPPLRRNEAAALLAERAAAIDREIDVSGVADAMCARLDDLPLAIELAVARLRAITPESLLARLDRSLALLTGGARDAPDRQRTLRATITWSVDLLTAEEQTLLARLSIFAGSFTLEAAESVCGATMDAVDALVSHSLVQRRGARYTMLQAIRRYAAEMGARLGSGERAQLARRHVAWYTNLALRTRDVVVFGRGALDEIVEQTDALRSERDNLVLAIDHALQRGLVSSAIEIAATGVVRFDLVMVGSLQTGYEVTTRVLHASADLEFSEALWSVMLAAATFAHFGGDDANAERWLESAMQRAPAGSIYRLVACAELTEERGDWREARRLYDECAWRDAPTSALAAALQYRGQLSVIGLSLDLGEMDEALRLAERALAWPDLGVLWPRLTALMMVARAYVHAGRSADACSLLRAVADTILALRSQGVGDVHVLWTYAMASEADDAPRAAVLFGATDAIQQARGLPPDFDPWGDAGTLSDARTRLSSRIGATECDAAWQDGKRLSFAEAIAIALAPRPRSAHETYGLTPREQEVLRLVTEGCSNAEIAQRLVISPNTVSVHVSRVLRKLEVSSRTQAAAKAHDEGLLDAATAVSG